MSLSENAKILDTALSVTSPYHFAAKHAWLRNENTNRIEKWQPWQYQNDIIWIILTHDVTYILKASQLGASWLLGIINDWMANFNETSIQLLLSQGQTEAKKLLDKVSFIHSRLPEYMARTLDHDNRESMTFKDCYSELIALASTEKAGHGFQGSIVTRDEVSRHKNARENFVAVSRAIDSGGKLVELSTANKEDPTNYFQEKTSEFYYDPLTFKRVLPSGVELYENPSQPGTCLVFLSWELRPVRYEGMTLEEWWDSRILPKYTPLQIEELYPAQITDVFKSSVTLSYFEYKALDEMGFDTCPPIKQSEYDTFNDMVRYYKLPINGRRYLLYTDPSDGVGDPFVTGVMDFITGEVVCSATGKVKVDRVAGIHDYLSRTYNATNSWEANAVGIAFELCIRDLKTPHIALRRNPSGEIVEGKYGTYVEGDMKGKVIFPDLAFAIAHRQIVCHDREFIQQAKLVKREGDKPVTEKKLTFDWVMMMAGLWQLSKFVPRSKFVATTYVPDENGNYVPIRG